MSDVFLSYARADVERASLLAQMLEARGWSVWWDRQIRPGMTWEDTIEKALTESKCVVVLWSAESVASGWVKAEAEDALSENKLVPARIEDVKPPLRYRFVQAADLIDWDGDKDDPGFQLLAGAIADKLGFEPEEVRETPAESEGEIADVDGEYVEDEGEHEAAVAVGPQPEEVFEGDPIRDDVSPDQVGATPDRDLSQRESERTPPTRTEIPERAIRAAMEAGRFDISGTRIPRIGFGVAVGLLGILQLTAYGYFYVRWLALSIVIGVLLILIGGCFILGWKGRIAAEALIVLLSIMLVLQIVGPLIW